MFSHIHTQTNKQTKNKIRSFEFHLKQKCCSSFILFAGACYGFKSEMHSFRPLVFSPFQWHTFQMFKGKFDERTEPNSEELWYVLFAAFKQLIISIAFHSSMLTRIIIISCCCNYTYSENWKYDWNMGHSIHRYIVWNVENPQKFAAHVQQRTQSKIQNPHIRSQTFRTVVWRIRKNFDTMHIAIQYSLLYLVSKINQSVCWVSHEKDAATESHRNGETLKSR